MKLYLTLFLLIILGCSSSIRMGGQYEDINDVQVVETILDYLSDSVYSQSVDWSERCFQVVSELSPYKRAGYYTTWNNQIEFQRKLPDIDTLYDATVMQVVFDGLSLDSTDLREKVARRYNLLDEDVGDYCIEWFASEDLRDGVMWFSPAIKCTKVGYYHVALHIDKDWDPWSYLFILKKSEGRLQVIDHYWNDNWPTRGIPEGISNLLEDH